MEIHPGPSHVSRYVGALLAGLLSCFGVACARDTGHAASNKSPAPKQPRVATAVSTASAGAPALPDFSSLVQKYGAAVVNVVSTREIKSPDTPNLSPDDPFYEFFRHFGMPQPNRSPQVERGEGSGFIVSPDGYILTNAHVVDDASKVEVELPDRREFDGKVVGKDARSDIAVLKIDARNLPTVRIGDSSKLRPGQWVAAIGAPFGFENSVTAGIVSATSRAVGATGGIVPFIQTDVPVNPGNSGGPLFDLGGEVVGINSMIYSGTGGYQGIAFAIPIDVAMDVEQQLLKTGHVTRGYLGVSVQELSAPLAQSFGIDRAHGALVSSVENGGPAAAAGIRPGDIIVGVNGRNVDESSQLPGLVAHLHPGETAKLNILRDGKPGNLAVRVDQLMEPGGQRVAAANDRSTQHQSTHPGLGLAVRPLTGQERSQAEVDNGLLVEAVQNPSAAAGVQPGDILLKAGSESLSSVADLQQVAQRTHGEVALLIQRQNARVYVPVPVK